MSSPATRAETTGIRVPPPVYLLVCFLAGVGLELAFPIDGPSTPVRIAVAVACGLAWLALDGWAMTAFVRAGTSIPPMRPSTVLVTSGAYRLSRNPMYVGMAFLYVALAFAFSVIWALALLPIAILALDRLVIAKEEPYLERTFGQPYLDYKRRVRRWL